MKKHFYLLGILCATALVFTACSKDDDTPQESKSSSTTSLYSVVQGASPRSAGNSNMNTTGVAEFDSRLEVPRVMGGTDNYLLVRRVDTYGVNYIVEWNNSKRAQRWTAYQCYTGNSGTNWNRDNWENYINTNQWAKLNKETYGYADPFQPDPDLPSSVRTELNEYKSSGYSRGHILGSADRLNSMNANEQTFYLSNMQPQTSALNERGAWYAMEGKVRNWNTSSFRETLYVVKGGTIDDSHIWKRTTTGLVVPEYFFMAALSKKGSSYKAVAMIFDHKNPGSKSDNLKNYTFTVDQLEELTGLDFFCNLPDDIENAVESTVDYSFWKLN